MKKPELDAGQIARSIRRRLGRTLAEIARECECTVSFLSKFETGHSQASLNNLHRIANALGVNVAALLPSSEVGRARVARARHRTIVTQPSIRGGDGISLEMVCGSDPADVFQVNLHRIAPGGRSDGQITHLGDEFIYLLTGEIRLFLARDTIILRPGDAATFSSREPHGYENVGEAEAVILWLNSPPTF